MEALARQASSGAAGPPPRDPARRERRAQGGGGGGTREDGREKRPPRENKHRPMEMSSKRPVGRHRDVMADAGVGYKARDPRFESLSGKFDEGKFRSRFKFLYDDTLPGERAALKKALRKEKKEDRRRQLQAALGKIDSQLQLEKQRRRRDKVERDVKDREKEAVRDGKTPYYPKKAVVKQLELLERYRELQKRGKGQVDKYLVKKRKKNASKDRRYMPDAPANE